MGSDAVLAAIIASVVSGIVALVTGLLGRPKVNAEARATSAGGEVAISADARAWAERFSVEAAAANQRAAAAEEKADHAEGEAAEAKREAAACRRETEDMRVDMDRLVTYALTLQRLVTSAGRPLPDPPPRFRPPL